MAGKDMAKVKLSRSILEMKFMKRTKEKVAQQLFDAEGAEYFENQLTTKMKSESGKYIIEPSFSFCEKLREGRFSFQGMNPDVEKILLLEQNKQAATLQKNKEMEISDSQMVNHYKSLKNTKIRRKFESRKDDDSLISDRESYTPKPKKSKLMSTPT